MTDTVLELLEETIKELEWHREVLWRIVGRASGVSDLKVVEEVITEGRECDHEGCDYTSEPTTKITAVCRHCGEELMPQSGKCQNSGECFAADFRKYLMLLSLGRKPWLLDSGGWLPS